MRKFLILIIVLAVLALMAVFFMPASWVLQQAPVAQLGMDMGEVSGNMWEGAAQNVKVGEVNLGEVRWVVNKAQAVKGTLDSDIEIKGDTHHITANMRRIDDRSFELRNIQGYVAAQTLASWLQVRSPGLDGRVTMDFPDGRIDGLQLTSLNGNSRWDNAAIRGAHPVALGQVDVSMQTTQPGNMQGDISSAGGDVRVDGVYSVTASQYSVDAMLAPQRQDTQIQAWLSQLGELQPDGSVAISHRGGRHSQIAIPNDAIPKLPEPNQPPSAGNP